MIFMDSEKSGASKIRNRFLSGKRSLHRIGSQGVANVYLRAAGNVGSRYVRKPKPAAGLITGFVSVLMIVIPLAAQAGQSSLDLHGEWNFAMDRADVGMSEEFGKPIGGSALRSTQDGKPFASAAEIDIQAMD